MTASSQLYKCWKNAVNSSVTILLDQHLLSGVSSVYDYLDKTYGCKTLHIQKRSLADKTIRYVDLEFASEKHLTLFMLKWSK